MNFVGVKPSTARSSPRKGRRLVVPGISGGYRRVASRQPYW